MNYLRVSLVVAVFVLWLAGPVRAASPAQTVNSLLAAHALKNPKSVVGLSIVDLRDGSKIAVLNDTRPCTPASNLKVFTSIFALTALGGQATFTTTAWLDGEDLYVTGQFDPTLGDPRLADAAGAGVYAELDRWAQALRTATDGKGVRRLLLACGMPGKGYRHEDWSAAQYDTWYEAPVAALNFQNNCFDVSFQVSGATRQTILSPAGRFFHVVDQTRVGPKHDWRLRLSDNDATVTLSGTVARTSTEPRPVPVNDPPQFFGRVLADRIARAGMPAPSSMSVVPPSARPAAAKAVAATVTPLATVMARANKRSLNMAAECMLLRAGDGTWAGSVRTMESVLTSNYHLAPGSLDLHDGSGLSKHNRVTPAAMTALLAGVLERKDAKIFVDSLPRAGVDGTLQRRLKDKAALGRIIAKTGYINNTHGLSGYIADKEGNLRVAFSILCNGTNAGARDLEDNITAALIKWLDGK